MLISNCYFGLVVVWCGRGSMRGLGRGKDEEGWVVMRLVVVGMWFRISLWTSSLEKRDMEKMMENRRLVAAQ